jgi:electron transfer flavoprotein alpha subunit
MAASILVIGEVADGKLTRLSAEVATLARQLAEAGSSTLLGGVVGENARAAAEELASHTGGDVAAVTDSARSPVGWAAGQKADYILIGASPDGRDIAGTLSVLLGIGVLGNATAVSWEDDGPVVEMSVFGGKLITRSAFTDGRGIITVRPNAVAASPAPKPGRIVDAPPGPAPELAPVKVVDRIEEAGGAASIEEARVIVSGGRGVGGEEGFKLVQELADALGGAVGATRAAVDAGWINYSQQIGQTGKIVKPQLYLALGVSGAIQHKVGMQTADTIVAVNRDPDAPIAEFADLVVVGDLFEVGPALLAELKSRGR